MIELHNLCDKGRQRELVYKRNYIYSELYKLNINLTQIGRMLDKDHVTVMHGLKVDKQFQNFDKIYNEIIAPIKEYLYPPNEIHKYSIFEDVIKCSNTSYLRMIKERIEQGLYIEQEVN